MFIVFFCLENETLCGLFCFIVVKRKATRRNKKFLKTWKRNIEKFQSQAEEKKSYKMFLQLTINFLERQKLFKSSPLSISSKFFLQEPKSIHLKSHYDTIWRHYRTITFWVEWFFVGDSNDSNESTKMSIDSSVSAWKLLFFIPMDCYQFSWKEKSRLITRRTFQSL